MEWYYDKSGNPVMYIYGDMFISSEGKWLCWIYNGSIYGLKSGKHIGWFENSKVYDSNNRVIAFAQGASNLPYMPGLYGTPGLRGIPGIPGRPGFGGVPGRPGYGGFSNYDVLSYFETNQ
ncbi:MAG: collagen-like protein [Bacilli bacterium]|nr:collagen-like protein [Bacilli bacterium]